MRAVVHFTDSGYVNFSADKITKENEWITVFKGTETVGLFDEGYVKCAYLTEKGDKNDIRKISSDKN